MSRSETRAAVAGAHRAEDRRTPATGWLVGQLPVVLARDPFVAGLVGIAQHIHAGVEADIAGIEHCVDRTVAPAPMLCFLASWLGLSLDPEEAIGELRRVVMSLGAQPFEDRREPVLGLRGTRRGLESLLRGVTGVEVEVTDQGGVFLVSEPMPEHDPKVTVRLSGPSAVTADRVHAYVLDELPIGAYAEVIQPVPPSPAAGNPGGQP